jgi:ATP-dependent exoDNAse (exonuclease V) beta subunit
MVYINFLLCKSSFFSRLDLTNKNKITFEIKHIHKIKGLKYEQVIVQKLEDLPFRAKDNKVHQSIFHAKQDVVKTEDVYDYIQELNKLYVMLTRSKKSLYIIVDSNRIPELIEIASLK